MKPEAKTAVIVEELLWTCSCGSPMGLEINNASGGFFDLDCSKCGLVGSVSVRPREQLRPTPYALKEGA